MTANSLFVFEGAEKKILIHFNPRSCSQRSNDLRTIPHEHWDRMLASIDCKALSCMENENITAFVLSESSLFLFPRAILLKTCGLTRLLVSIPLILELARIFCDLEASQILFCRKNFLQPEKQPAPHTSFQDEVRSLHTFFLTLISSLDRLFEGILSRWKGDDFWRDWRREMEFISVLPTSLAISNNSRTF